MANENQLLMKLEVRTDGESLIVEAFDADGNKLSPMRKDNPETAGALKTATSAMNIKDQQPVSLLLTKSENNVMGGWVHLSNCNWYWVP